MGTMILTPVVLLIFSSCIIMCHCGSRTCDVVVKVRRGTVCKASPLHTVVLECPVQHCGETVDVVWCKILDTDKCGKLNDSKHVHINQTTEGDGELVSFLTFKRISEQDAGLYRCQVNKHVVGHFINVSVSATHQGVQTSDGNGNEPANVPKEDVNASLAFVSLCLCIVLLLFTVTAIALFQFNYWKLRRRQKTPKETATHTKPDLPQRSPHVLQNSLSTVHEASTSVTVTSSQSEMNNNQPVANTSAQLRGGGVYAVINRSQRSKAIQNSSTGQSTSSENNAISVLDSSVLS